MIELDWKYLIEGGEVERSLKEWDLDPYPHFSAFDLYYRIDKDYFKIEDGRFIFPDEKYGWFKTKDIDVPFKPYHFREDLDKEYYCYSPAKINSKSMKTERFIAHRNVIFDNDVKRNLKKFRNKYNDRLNIIEITKNNLQDYVEKVKYIHKTWKKTRLEQKKIFNPRSLIRKYSMERGFEFYDELDYFLYTIDDFPVAFTINCPVNKQISYYEIGLMLDDLPDGQKIVGLSSFIYAFRTRYNKVEYRDMGFATGRPGLADLKKRFTVYTVNEYFTDLGRPQKEEKPNAVNISSWFQ